MDSAPAAVIVAGVLLLATPILFAAMGGLVTQRVGIWNIGIEGFMLGGAFTAAVVTYQFGIPWLGVLGSMLAGAALSLLMGFVVITLKVDQFVAGLALNSFATAFAIYLMVTMFQQEQSLVSERIVPLPDLREFGVGAIPGIGPVLAPQTPLTLLAFLSVLAVSLLLSRTGLGLRIRAVGDAPESARASGIGVERTQYIAMLIGGALAGMGGAQLSIGQLSLFFIAITAGRGVIAFAAVVAGGARPWLVTVAVLIIAIAEQTTIQLSGSDIPSQLVQMTPYLLAVLAVSVATIVASRVARRSVRAARPTAGNPEPIIEGADDVP